ncbi:enoyl-CoA hydratase-related protein [Streptomyces sp. NBC_01320]|uniref:enoyl-CoA hydratase-related protein n=1 Tax=Streptomyces sp. NBC_01320 TaxID=2903824 RepID=UPI003FA36BAC
MFGTDPRPNTGRVVLTGSDRAFAAGASFKEVQPRGYLDMCMSAWFSAWDRLAHARSPTVEAVAVRALGGGCELRRSPASPAPTVAASCALQPPTTNERGRRGRA